MITDFPQHLELRELPEQDTLNLLDKRGAIFHLGGSYYFGCHRPDSDVDFITDNTDETVEFLLANGFTRMGEAEEAYDVTVDRTRGVFQKGKVQVQVVKDLRATLLARNILSAYFPAQHKEASRETRREVWDMLISAVRNVEWSFENPLF